jgi:hypothetical protein
MLKQRLEVAKGPSVLWLLLNPDFRHTTEAQVLTAELLLNFRPADKRAAASPIDERRPSVVNDEDEPPDAMRDSTRMMSRMVTVQAPLTPDPSKDTVTLQVDAPFFSCVMCRVPTCAHFADTDAHRRRVCRELDHEAR